MDVFIAWDGDHIGRQVGRAALDNDESKLRQISHAIERGNQVWRSWVESHGGAIISYGGDEGRAKIDSRHLEQLPQIRHEYQTLVNAPVSIGIGQKLSEADRALIAAKLRGGDQVVLYTPEIEAEIKAQPQRSEADKLSEEYLDDQSDVVKAEGDGGQGTGAGTTGAHRPQKPKTPAGPRVEGSEHSEGEAAKNFAEENAPASPEKTHTAEEMEQAFHDAAAGSDPDDEPVGEDQHTVVTKVTQVLQDVRRQAKTIAKLKEAAPDAYKAVMELVSSMIEIARSVGGGAGQTVQKTEAASAPLVPPTLPGGSDPTPAGVCGNCHAIVPAGHVCGNCVAKSEGESTVYRVENDQGEGPYKAGDVKQDNSPARPTAHEDFEPDVYQGMDENGWRFAFESPDQATSWFGPNTMRTLVKRGYKLVAAKASKVFPSKSGKQVIYVPAEKLDKKLPMPHANPHHHVQWPVGSVRQKDQKVKVQHQDGGAPGKTGWVQVQAGEILSQDGHAISSRNPGGR